MTTTIDRINALANERLGLWLKAGRQGYSTSADYQRLHEIARMLDHLWHRRRVQGCDDVFCSHNARW